MDKTQTTLQHALEYRNLRGLTDAEFVAVVARIAHPDADPTELEDKYDIPATDMSKANEFLFDPEGMLEDLKGMLEWRKPYWLIAKESGSADDSFQSWFMHEVEEREFLFRRAPVTTRQSQQVEEAASGDWQFVNDALDIIEQKSLHGDTIHSPVGLLLKMLTQPRDKIRNEATEWRRKAKKRPTINREPILD